MSEHNNPQYLTLSYLFIKPHHITLLFFAQWKSKKHESQREYLKYLTQFQLDEAENILTWSGLPGKSSNKHFPKKSFINSKAKMD